MSSNQNPERDEDSDEDTSEDIIPHVQPPQPVTPSKRGRHTGRVISSNQTNALY